MPRTPFIPAQLTAGPFTLADAREAGLDRWHLRGSSWHRVAPRTYLWSGLTQTPALSLTAAHLRLPPAAAFSGRTAAWLHGIDVEPCDPIEVTVPKAAGVAARSGLALSRAALPDSEVVMVRGWRTTSIVRTLRDLCSRLSVTEAVVVLDMALHARIADLTALKTGATSKLRRVLSFAESATESPMESRLRMLLCLGGLPRPQAQVPLTDRRGRFLGRPDLYYPDHGLALEYDGGIHRDRLVQDNRRQNRLVSDGIRLLRFTAGDILRTPDLVLSQVRAMLVAGEAGHQARLASSFRLG